MKKANKWFVVSVVLFLIILCLSGIIIYDNIKDNQIAKLDDNKVTENNEENSSLNSVVGSFGSSSTYIKSNFIEATIENDGTINAKKYDLHNFGTGTESLLVNGIIGTPIRIVKTYTCADDTFKIAVLTDDGNAYVADFRGNTLEFRRIMSESKILGIDTKDFPFETTCMHSLITLYKEDGKEYVVQPKISYENEFEFRFEEDENGNSIYYADTLYEDYKNSKKD